ncbi:MAG: 4Fe-4S dicluster domain-containing protein [bacterium]
MKTEEKLALDVFKVDEKSHILVDNRICRSVCKVRYCLRVCPAELYSYEPGQDEIRVEYAGCLECGTCLVACRPGAISWSYPKGGRGVQYRFG